jgi:hypothetical protein
MDRLSQYEQEFGAKLPIAFKNFYYSCNSAIPHKLVGTDLINRNPELKKWAIEILHENKIFDTLDDNDFVFMMHQGYMFWYFKVDGDENPVVYGFSETEGKITGHGNLKAFLQEILE